MSRDLAEKEREFLETLKDDTGRSLGEWMSAISAQEFEHRNDAIDWLRQQGFLFSWASWLERIHHNDGRPIYCNPDSQQSSEPAAGPLPAAAAKPEPQPARPALRLVSSSPAFDAPKPDRPVSEASAATAPPAVTRSNARPAGAQILAPEVQAVISAAKAYAPLAGFVVRRIAELVPDATLSAGRKQLEFAADGRPFALLVVGGKDLRLLLAGSPETLPPPFEKARLGHLGISSPPGLTHMLILTDARQVDNSVDEALRAASVRVTNS